MKKTFNIHLGGAVFTIDEEAYDRLNDYLNRYTSPDEEGSDEKLKEEESRIARHFRLKREQGEEVITLEEVEEAIRPQELSVPSDAIVDASPNPIKRKFFRNPKGKMLGGLCSGLAAYYDWDITLVRLMAVFLLFTFHFVLPVYIVFWIITPEARTDEQKRLLYGKETVNLDTDEEKMEERTGGKLFRAVVKGLGVLLLCGAFLFWLLLGSFLLFALVILIYDGFSVLPNEIVPDFDGLTVRAVVMGLICLSFAVIIPVVALIHTVLRAIFRWRPANKYVRWVFGVVWLLCFVLCIYYFFLIDVNNVIRYFECG